MPAQKTETQSPLFKGLPIPVFATDAKSQVTAWNDAMAEITGLSAEDAIGKRAWRCFFAKRRRTPVDEAIVSGEAISETFEFTNRLGEPICLTAKVTPQLDAVGELEGTTAIFIDSTDGTDVHAANRLRWALEGCEVAMMTIDRDLIITWANPAAQRMIERNIEAFRSAYPGFRPDAVIGTSIDELHDNPGHKWKLLEDASNLPWTTELVVDERTFRIDFAAMRDTDDNYVGCSLEWSDVTALRARENHTAMVQSTLHTAATPIMMCDADRIITYANPSLERLLTQYVAQLREVVPDFDPTAIVGRNIDLFHTGPTPQGRTFIDPDYLPSETEIEIGSLEFGIAVAALHDATGAPIGTCLEWRDLNPRAAYRTEVAALYNAATCGELAHRGDLGRVDETFAPMLAGINRIVGAIASPVADIQQSLERISSGDLTAFVTTDYQGDYATLKDALNGTLRSLNDTLRRVRIASNQITDGSNEVSSASGALSQGASTQATSIQEISAHLSAMTKHTDRTAQNAAAASELAAAVSTMTTTGDGQMKAMLTALAELEASRKDLSKTIKTIDEIAFQTNLLALNGAVEAARAGAHGNGFAVVVEEVRALAARSADAARKMTETIEGSTGNLSHGTAIANDTARAFAQIATSAGKVNGLVGEIATASGEQAKRIVRIDDGLAQVDTVTQHNRASAEHGSTTAQQLSDRATELQNLLGKFTIEQGIADLPSTVTPELLEAIHSYLTAQQHPTTGRGQPTRSKAARTPPVMRVPPAGTGPNDVISLDDPDLGPF